MFEKTAFHFLFQPVTQQLQINAQMAAIRGNTDEASFHNKAMNYYMLEHNCHPIKSALPMLTQAVFFTSMFFGLRGMCNVPVVSMQTGGLAWFVDLTASDPTMVLPVITCSTLYLQLYLGADGMDLSAQPEWVKKVKIL